MRPARAGNFATPLNAYTLADDTVKDALKKMLEFNISKIAVCNKNFKIIGGISKNQIKNLLKNQKTSNIDTIQKYLTKDILDNGAELALAYTGSNIREVTSAMQTLNLKLMPVVKSPWDRELKGFLELKHLKGI